MTCAGYRDQDVFREKNKRMVGGRCFLCTWAPFSEQPKAEATPWGRKRESSWQGRCSRGPVISASPAERRSRLQHKLGMAGDRVPPRLCQTGGRASAFPSAESAVTPRACDLQFCVWSHRSRGLSCPPVGVRSVHPHPRHPPPPRCRVPATHPGTARRSSTPRSAASSG